MMDAEKSLRTELEPRRVLEEAAVANLLLKERRYSRDPWLWLTEEVMTIDETTREILPWPAHKLYTKDLLTILQHERLVAIPKSRRMMVSWLVAAWVLWNIRFKPHCAVFWQADKEEHAAHVLDWRIKFMEDHLVTEALRKPYVTHRTEGGLVGKIEFLDTKSYCRAIPQGSRAVRSYTFSIMVMDESEFQQEASDAYAAAVPIAEKGAQLIIMSSSNGPNGILSKMCQEVGFTRFS